MQNPFYQTYRAAAIMAGAEPHYLRHSGFPEFAVDLRAARRAHARAHVDPLPLLAVEPRRTTWWRQAQMRRAIEAARRHDFLVVFDECYAELYDDAPPPGALDVLAAIDSSERWLDNVLVLHSLSKRSSAAGMRSGFAVGPRDVIAALNRVRLNGTGVHAAAAARGGDGALVGGHARRGDARAALPRRKDTADRLLGALSPATTGRPAASSCGSASTTGSR